MAYSQRSIVGGPGLLGPKDGRGREGALLGLREGTLDGIIEGIDEGAFVGLGVL